MKIEIRYNSHFSFRLEKPQLEILVKLAERHYDHHCKAYSKEYEKWLNRIINFPEIETNVGCSWRDLDVTMKVMECTFGLTDRELALVHDMRAWFMRAMIVARNRTLATKDLIE